MGKKSTVFTGYTPSQCGAMATTTPAKQHSTRFSLLLLEHSEVLLSDLAVQYRFIPDAVVGSSLHPLSSYPQRFVSRSANTSIRGRVKLATRSIFFDSDDWRHPIIRLPLLSVEHARLTRDRSRSCESPPITNNAHPSSSSSSSLPGHDHPVHEFCDDDFDNSVLVSAASATFQRELAIDHPYIDAQIRGRHILTPLYTKPDTLLEDINELLKITAISSSRIRDERLKELVQQREALVPFDITLLEHGVKENAIIDAPVSAVYPMSTQPGRFRVTPHNIYFMPIHGESSQSVERIAVSDVTTIRTLRHGCRNAAFEIAYLRHQWASNSTKYGTLMLSFPSCQLQQRAITILQKVAQHPVENYDRRQLEVALNKWRTGDMSNFEYLMYLNFAAGRSFNDLSQYPIFPWIVQDYASAQLDLTNEKTFRDLSKPIGALNEVRLHTFTQSFREMPPPRFFYGTHYSTPAYVINYLLRAAPAAMLRLQNGRFDIPDRLFHNISSSWQSVLNNRGDVKELIPEFYTLNFSDGLCSGVMSSSSGPGEFLDNVLGLDLGVRQDGNRVDDVELPPWAHGSSHLFVHKLREALECAFVSRRIHAWIDLIFGVKSRNVDAFNVFYTDVALPDSIEAGKESKISNEELTQIETVYLEFGRTPQKLFQHRHPPRFGDSDDDGLCSVEVAKDCDEVEYHGSGHNEQLGLGTGNDNDNIIETGGGASQTKNAHCVQEESVTDLVDSLRKNPTSSPPKKDLRSSFGRPEPFLGGARNHILPTMMEMTEGGTASELLHSSISCIIDEGKTPPSSSMLTHARIMDMCMIENNEECDKMSIELPMVCTVWDDGYLKVHSGSKILRSRFITGICSVAFLGDGIIAFGSRGGNIGLYFIETARNEIMQEGAHDCDVLSLNILAEEMLLVSGSRDGSVKLWGLEWNGRLVRRIRFIQEMDAESCVEDVCAICERYDEEGYVLVAAWTSDGTILAWKLQPDDGQQFVDPIWRRDVVSPTSTDEKVSRRKHMVLWLDQGPKKKPLLVCGNEEDQCIRVWQLDPEVMVRGEVYLSEDAVISISGWYESKTFLVAGRKGKIEEYDSTGLCVGQIIVGNVDAVQMTIKHDGASMLVWDRQDRILRVSLQPLGS